MARPRIRQFAGDMGISYDEAKGLIKKAGVVETVAQRYWSATWARCTEQKVHRSLV